MPQLDKIPSTKLTKALCAADSGTGKTGALAGLAAAGYRLIIADFDNGTQILMDEKILPKEYRKNVVVVQYLDKIRATASGPMIEEPPTAFSTFMQHLERHPDVGPISALGNRDVFVVDSGTFLGEAIMRFQLFLNGRLNKPPQLQDWGSAMDKMEELFALWYSSALPCHLIVNFHLAFIGGDQGNNQMIQAMTEIAKNRDNKELSTAAAQHLVGAYSPTRVYPSALGRKLPPKVGRYFNTLVSMKSVGAGASERRVMLTRSEGDLALKVPCPSKISQILPIETAWPSIFKAIEEASPA